MCVLGVIMLSLFLHLTQQQKSHSNACDTNIGQAFRNYTCEKNATEKFRNDYSHNNVTAGYKTNTNTSLYEGIDEELKHDEKKCGNEPNTDHRCGCDPYCAKYGDCCPDSIYFKDEEQKLGASTASCHRELNRVTHFYVMKRCPPEWQNQYVRHLCENPDLTYPNPMLDTLITSLRTNITYHNSYCASCHDDLHQDMFLWSLNVSCHFNSIEIGNLESLDYFQRMFYNESTSTWHMDLSKAEICAPCSITLKVGDVGQSFTVNCPSPNAFPNATKALCKLRPKWEERMLSEGRLRLCEETISSCASNWNNTTEKQLCEAYTAHISTCGRKYRNYHCALCNGVVYKDPGCIPRTRTQPDTCTNINFTKEEYILSAENNTVFVPSLKMRYYSHEFLIQDERLVLCLPIKTTRQFGSHLKHITTIGLSLSITCIILHLVVLCITHKLINLPSMNLASLCVSLLLLYSSFILSRKMDTASASCLAVAIILHYSMLASFFWMLIISFDIWSMARRTKTKLLSLKGVQVRRFMFYSAVGWLLPIFIVGSAVLLDYTIPDSYFAPGYGGSGCWFTRMQALLVFGLTPLICVMCLNTVFFIWTSHLIRQMRCSRRTATAHRNFALNLRLFSLMGLTWITGILAAALDAEVLWYVFVVFNSTQGVFIFLAFSCNSKVRQELQRVFKKSRD